MIIACNACESGAVIPPYMPPSLLLYAETSDDVRCADLCHSYA